MASILILSGLKRIFKFQSVKIFLLVTGMFLAFINLIEAQTTWYSYQSGNWAVGGTNWRTWTLDPSGTTLINPSNVNPGVSDNVVILNGRFITIPIGEAAKTVASVTIQEGAVLDITNTTGHNFGANLNGSGLLRLSTPTFPGFAAGTFVATGGGTVEYYNNANFNFIQLTYNNLIINLSNTGIVATLMGNMTLNGNLTINQGRFQINNNAGASRSVTINGNVLVSSPGYIQLGTGNYNHTFTVKGDFTNYGSVDFYEGNAPDYTGTIYNTTAHADVVFNNDLKDQNLICNGYSEFYRIGIYKGTDWTYSLNINADNSSNFYLYGRNNNTHTNDGDDNLKALGLTSGTLILGQNIIIPGLTSPPASTNNYDINSVAQLIIDGANVSTADVSSDMAVVIYGKLLINSGTFDATNTRASIITRRTSNLTINGGTITATQLRTSNEAGTHRGAFIMTGGTLNLITNTATLSWADNSRRHATLSFTYPDNVFKMSGGVINILGSTPQIDQGGGTSGFNFSIVLGSNPENISITGGEINVTIPTIRPAYITSTVPFWDLNVIGTNGTYSFGVRNFNATSGTPTSVTAKPLIVYNNFILQNNAAFDNTINTQNIYIGGNFNIASGTTYTPATNTTYFDGSRSQTFDIQGTITGNLNNMVLTNNSSLTLNNANPVVPVVINANFQIDHGCTFIDNGRILQVQGNITNSGIHFKPVSGAGSIRLAGTAAQLITGDGTGSFNNLSLNKTAGSVTIGSNFTITGDLRLANTAARLNIGLNNLTLTTGADVYDGLTGTGKNFNASRMIQTNGLESDAGISKVYNSTGAFVFPFGFFNTANSTYYYMPASIQFSSGATQYGTVTNRPVNSRHPLAQGVNNALTCYWKTTGTGFTGIPGGSVVHKYYYDNAGSNYFVRGNEALYIPAVHRSGDSWTVINNNLLVNDGTNEILFDTASVIDGEYTAGELPAFNIIPVRYSTGVNGDWNNTATWSATAVGGPGGASIPDANTIVIIGDASNNHTVYINQNGIVCGSLTIFSGSTLDLRNFTGHNFESFPDQGVTGTGTLRIRSNNYFPQGDFGDFIGENGGTVEYYTTAANITLPVTSDITGLILDHYYNLKFSPANATTINLPAGNLNIYNDLTVSGLGTGQVLTNTTAPRSIIVNHDFNLVSGLFEVRNTNIQTIQVLRNLDVTGTFRVQNSAAVNHILELYGNLSGSGTFQAFNGTGRILTYFKGTTNATITGAAKTFYSLEVNKGASQAPVLDVSSSITTNFDPALTLLNGTFRLSNGTLNVTTANSFNIPQSACLSANGGTLNIITADNNNLLTLAGKLEILSGIVNVGNTSNNNRNDIEYAAGGRPEIIIQGGTLNVKGQIRRNVTYTQGYLRYAQSNGIVNIYGKNQVNTRAKLEICNDSSLFLFSNGIINIYRGGGVDYGDLYIRPDISNVTGGTINLAPVTAIGNQIYTIDATCNLHHLYITGLAGNTATANMMVNPLVLTGDLFISTNSTFNSNDKNINIAGNFTNNGAYNAGTNKTTFNGGNTQTASFGVNTTFRKLIIDKNSGSVITFSSPGAFQPTITDSLSITSGTLTNAGNLNIIAQGNIINNGIHTSTGAGSFTIQGTTNQIITSDGNGQFGNMNITNGAANGVTLNGDISINGVLTLTTGYFYTNDFLLTLENTSTIGGTPGVPANRNWIITNGVLSDAGVKKIYPAVSPSSFTFPIGVAGKFTPATYNVTFSAASPGSITLKPVNVKIPSLTDLLSNELQYYWNVTSTPFGGMSSVTHTYNYIQTDVTGTETNYVGARYYNYIWTNLGAGVMNTGANTITITGNYLDGEYTCGEPGNFLIKPIYYSYDLAPNITTTGADWNAAGSWATGSHNGTPAGSPPSGNPIIIKVGHRINVVNDDRSAYSVLDNGVLNLNSTTGHNFGHVSGNGRIIIGNTGSNQFVFPGGIFNDFMNTTGSTIEYYGTGVSGSSISPIIKTYQNVEFTGPNSKSMANMNLLIKGNIIIRSSQLINSSYNKNIIVWGNWDDNFTNGFVPGTGLVSFEGTSQQTISTPSPENFYNFRINNANGITLNGTAQISNRLILINGRINTTNANLLTISNTSQSAVTGGSDATFVNGPLSKQIISGQSFNFPVGNYNASGGKPVRYGNVMLSNVSSTGYWRAQYTNDNPDGSYSRLNILSPITTVSDNEYWTITRPGVATANVRIRWDDFSNIVSVNSTRLVEWVTPANRWEEKGNVLTGNLTSGTVASSTPVSTDSYVFTVGVSGVTARITNVSPATICNNGEIVTVTVVLTGTPNWTLSYTAGGNSFVQSGIGIGTYNIQLTGADFGGAGSHNIQLTAVSDNTTSGIVDATTFPVTVNSTYIPDIQGTFTVGAGEIRNYLTTNNTGSTYAWEWVGASGGTIATPSAASTDITMAAASSYQLQVSETTSNGCVASDIQSIIVVNTPSPDITPTDPNVCLNEVVIYSTPSIAGHTYAWTVIGGTPVSGAGNSITVTWNVTGNGSVSVLEDNIGITGTDSVNVVIDPQPNTGLTLSAPASVCYNTSSNITVQGSQSGFNYQLRTGATNIGSPVAGTGGNINLPTGTLVVNTTFNILASNNGCSSQLTSTPTINVNPQPGAAGAIAGTSTVCEGQNGVSYSVGAIADATSYNWSYSGTGATITGNTNPVAINFAVGATNGNLTVEGVNVCGTGTVSADYPIVINSVSSAPTGITVSNNNTCLGTTKTLTPTGGTPGTNATYNWYSEAACTNLLHTGNTYDVNPATSTSYWVRLEGDCNTTATATATVTVSSPSVAPTGITVSNNNTCLGTTKTLTPTGGTPGTNATYNWYSEAACTNLLHTGNTYDVNPATSTSYWVRLEGDCNTTATATATVTVSSPSIAPTGITVSNNNTCLGTTKTLTPTGGTPGTNATYNWYSEAACTNLLHTGATYDVNPATSTSYWVRLEGDCNTTVTATATVTVSSPSVAPTGITVSNNNTCLGTTKTLTPTGGTPGTNATYNWYSEAACTNLLHTGATYDVNPATSTSYWVRLEGDCNTTATATATVTVSSPSIAPTGITVSNNNTCLGTTKTLTPTGGTPGTNATYNWYSEAACTNLLHTGNTYDVNPATSTSYWVRLEGDCNTTATATATVTVSSPSIAPTGITVSNNNTCLGTTKTLTPTGGTPGTNATYNWYSEAACTNLLHTGNTYDVNPATSTSYWVRLEGDCNTTATATATVTVSSPSVAPTGITVSNNNTCLGTTKTLTPTGGTPGTNATYNWYSEAACTNLLHTGATYDVNPATSTSYWVRLEGDCNTTATATATVTVSSPSIAPTGITVSNNNTCLGTTKTLTPTGGTPGTNATYNWYSEAACTNLLHTGATYDVNPATSTSYWVRLEGDCNTTVTATATVTVSSPSIAPTGITVSNNNTCLGTTKTLTPTGGTPGTNATYNWYSEAACTNLLHTGATYDVNPATSTSYWVRLEGDCNTTATATATVTVSSPSVAPTGITVSNNNTCLGTTKTLTPTGGTPGTNATYNWYSEAACTNLLHTGATYDVNPATSTSYWVRLEGDCNTTATATATVTVSSPSIAPTGITVSNNNTCLGTTKTLTPTGGTPGTNATYNWYSEAACTNLLHTGATYDVNPATSTSYWVRLEGDCNTTVTATATVTVSSPSIAPTGITVSNNNTCLGTTKTLTPTGGTPGTNATYNWYSEAACTNLLHTGATYDVNPATSTSYWVRLEGDCNTTATATATVTVSSPSIAPTGITVSNNNTCLGTTKTLTPTGGTPGTNATYNWYSEAACTNLLHTGATYDVNPATSTSYWVRLEGDCNTTVTATATVTVSSPSIAPTGITVSNNNTCLGTTKTLTPTGGTPGTNATYNWYSEAACTNLLHTGATYDVNPATSTSYWVRLEGDCNTTVTATATVTVSSPSIAPTGITVSNNNTCLGTTKTLTPNGGTPGTNATYNWYSEAACTNLLHTGATYDVNPATSTSYWVRLEGDCNTTATATATVTVSSPSIAPTGITVSNNNTCLGTTKTLTPTGGTPGTNATYNWYSEAACTNLLHTGNTYDVNPATSTSYWVRLEGDCNTTATATATVTVSSPSVAPTGITVSNNNTCLGTTKTLTPTGGTPGTNATYNWYSEAACTNLLHTGATYDVNPATSTSYWVRLEGDCNTTATATATVTVSSPSIAPTGITVSNNNTCLGTTKTLTPIGGTPGTNATYNWYSEAACTNLLHTGATYDVNPATSTSYWVRLEGDCNTTATATATVTVSSPSIAPTGITVSNNNTCLGTTKTLTPTGGTPGTNATYNWYSEAACTNLLHTGATYDVNPATSTSYWVRLEGDCNTTATATATVTVSSPSIAPTGITVSNNNTCLGTTKTLTPIGGTPGTNATYNWYSEAACTNLLHTGATYDVNPATSTSYWVRLEGDCNTTATATATVTVSSPSIAPTGITVTNNNTCLGTTKTLTPTGGTPGTNATYNWYSEAACTNLLHTGNTYDVNPAASTSYWVRLEGDCNTTVTATATVTVSSPSIAPTGITVSNNNTCLGTTKTLTPTGGTPGTNATYNWYSEAACTNLLHTGATYDVNPATSTSYWVRLEGDCNTTATATATVTVSSPSVAPTGITVSNNNTCLGTTKTLTPTGGTPGTNATYNWYSEAACTNLLHTGATYDVNPATSTSYWVRLEGDCNTTATATATVTVSSPSIAPTGITVSNNNTCLGTTKTLTPTGGTPGTNATYNWYSEAACTNLLHTGATYDVNPATSTSYWVRLEGDCNTTATATATVTVSSPSVAPTGITVSNNNTCLGTTKTLTPTGGTPGTNATYNWYTEAACTNLLHTGATYDVNPATSTSYWVRLEGDCNTTATATATVTVSSPSIAPTGITVTNNNTCLGTTKTLTPTGGTPGTNATYNWYSEAACTNLLHTGATYDVNPATSTSYWVRLEGDCNTTATATATVTVSSPSVAPTGITVSNNNTCLGTTKTLTPTGGTPGTNATYNWYSEAACTNLLHTGATYDVNPATSTSYWVRLEGDCNTTATATATVTVTPTVGTPTAITISAGIEPTCKLTNGTTTTTYSTTATNSTGFNWSLSNGAAGSINATSGLMTWADGFSGTVDIQVTANGCNGPSIMVSSTVQISSGIPAEYNVTGTGTYCTSGTGLPVTLSSSELGVNYQLLVGGVNDGAAVIGDGNPLVWNNKTAGVYTVVATNGCGSTPMNDSAAILVTGSNPAVFNVMGTGIYCTSDPGLTVTLNGSELGVSYQLVKNGIDEGSPVIGSGSLINWPNKLEGIYKVNATNGCGTTPMNDSAEIIISGVYPTVYNVTGTGTYCTGDPGLTVKLSGSETGVSYQLLKDAANDSLPIIGNGNPITWNNKKAGIYRIVATNGCGNTNMNGTARIIVVSGNPALFDVTGTDTYCTSSPGLPVKLNGSDIGINYQLQKDGSNDGMSVIGNGDTIIWNNKTEGTYTVTATNGCGSSDMNSSAIITKFNTPPSGDTVQSFCLINPVIADLTATGIGIQWYPTIIGGTSMDTTTLLVNNNYYFASQTIGGCESDARLKVRAVIKPVPSTSSISGDTTALCYEENKIYSVIQTVGSTYSWKIPANSSITSDTTLNTVSINFGSVSGTISVIETNTEGCKGTEQTLPVKLIGCELDARFIADKTTICLGDTITFTSESIGTTATSQYDWNFGTGANPQIITGVGPHKVIFGSAGLKTISLIVTEGLSDTLTISNYIEVYNIPSATIRDSSRCGAGSVLFTVENGTFDKVEFSNDNGLTTIAKAAESPYTYSTTLQENDSIMIWARVFNSTTGCNSDWVPGNWTKAYPAPKSFKILNLRDPNTNYLNYVDIVCGNDSGVYAIVPNTGSTYSWTISALNIVNEVTNVLPVLWNLNSGNYQINVVETNQFGCKSPVVDTTVKVSVPVADLGGNVQICSGQTHVFTTSEPFTLYQWQDGSTLPMFTANADGQVKVMVTDQFGCEAADSAMVSLYESPILNLGNDTILCGNGAYRLDILGYSDYLWSTGETSNYIYIYPGKQTISLTVTNSHGCSDTDTLNISECIPKNLLGTITNAFTPNGDGNHDTWVINNIELFPNAKIDVFDRWGRLVFSVDGGYKNNWDGKFNGKDLPMDNYYYIIELNVPGVKPITGNLTIVR